MFLITLSSCIVHSIISMMLNLEDFILNLNESQTNHHLYRGNEKIGRILYEARSSVCKIDTVSKSTIS